MAKTLNEMSDKAFVTLARNAARIVLAIVNGENVAHDDGDKDANKNYRAAASVGKHVIDGKPIGSIAREAHNRLQSFNARKEQSEKDMVEHKSARTVDHFCADAAMHKDATRCIEVCTDLLTAWEACKALRDAAQAV